MAWVFLLVLAVIGLAIGLGMMAFSKTSDGKGIGVLVSGGTLAVFLFLTFFMSMAQVDTGQVGVVYSFGQIQNETLPPGRHFIAPWKDVKTANVQVQKEQFADGGIYDQIVVKR